MADLENATEPGNNSGTGGPPPEWVRGMGWCWGAFGLGWLWGAGNNVPITLVLLFPYAAYIPCGYITSVVPNSYGVVTAVMLYVFPGLALVFRFWLGINGHVLAWRHRRFVSADAFRSAMRYWKVVGIVALVIVYPLLGAFVTNFALHLREYARDPYCSSNMHQIAEGMFEYAKTHKDRLPNAANWQSTIDIKHARKDVFRCPDGLRYFMNPRLSGAILKSIAKPDKTVLLYEADDHGVLQYWHYKRTHVWFVGSSYTRSLTPEQMASVLW